MIIVADMSSEHSSPESQIASLDVKYPKYPLSPQTTSFPLDNCQNTLEHFKHSIDTVFEFLLQNRFLFT